MPLWCSVLAHPVHLILHTDTTDVQSVKVAEVADSESVWIKCSFMAGSDATGCMVVFLGELGNTTVTLMKDVNDKVKMIVHKLPFPLVCYDQVFAYDIESDGSTGTLAVPGIMQVTRYLTREVCSPPVEAPVQGKIKCMLLKLCRSLVSLFMSKN